MKLASRARNLSRSRAQAARMNELDRVIKAVLEPEGFSHRDTDSYTERSWQNDRPEMHIGFRA